MNLRSVFYVPGKKFTAFSLCSPRLKQFFGASGYTLVGNSFATCSETIDPVTDSITYTFQPSGTPCCERKIKTKKLCYTIIRNTNANNRTACNSSNWDGSWAV